MAVSSNLEGFLARALDDVEGEPDQASRLAVSSNLEGFLARALDEEGEPDQASHLVVSPNFEVLDKVLA